MGLRGDSLVLTATPEPLRGRQTTLLQLCEIVALAVAWTLTCAAGAGVGPLWTLCPRGEPIEAAHRVNSGLEQSDLSRPPPSLTQHTVGTSRNTRFQRC